jgi:hypothetical protein
MPFVDLLRRDAIGLAEAGGRRLYDHAVMVAADRGPVEVHEEIGGLARLERTGQAVAEV